MRRCQSWRPTGVTHVGHRPGGGCRKCWKPCRSKVPKGVRRCETCTTMLSFHPDPDVRCALAEDPDLPYSTIELLATDLHPGVASVADGRLMLQLGAGAPDET